VQRVKSVALWLTDKLGQDEIKSFVERAAVLAKADLVTDMVYELQMCRALWAANMQGKPASPKKSHLPSMNSTCPGLQEIKSRRVMRGAILGLAERADTIAAIYKIGLEPTSSQDPYGLRRAARCINEIIWGLGLDIDTRELMAEAAMNLDLDAGILAKIDLFLKQRLQVQLREKGLKHEVVALALQTIPSRPLQAARMADTLQKSSDEEWFGDLITAAVRVKNILEKAEEIKADPDSSKFTDDSEKALFEKLKQLAVPVKDAVDEFEWEKLASCCLSLLR